MLHKVDRLFGKLGEFTQALAWLLLRVVASAMLMTHGFDKLFGDNPQAFRGSGMTTVNIGDSIAFAMPWDLNALFVAGVIEFFGGLLLLLGLWTHMMALLAVLLMIMAYSVAHLAWFPTLNNGELAAMYFLVYLALFAYGPGDYSLDYWFALRRHRKKTEKMEALENSSS